MVIWGSFWIHFGLMKGFRKHSKQELRKMTLRGPTISLQNDVFGPFWAPGEGPKSLKITKMGSQKSLFFWMAFRMPFFLILMVFGAKMEPKINKKRHKFKSGERIQNRSEKTQLFNAARRKTSSKKTLAKEIAKRSQRGDIEYTSCFRRYNEGREVGNSTNKSTT